MKISKYINSTLLVFFSVLCLSVSYFIAKDMKKPVINISKQDSTFNLNDGAWKYFHLGQKRLISSLLWIATIIESDHEHYKGKDLNSWMYLRFKTISILEPEFYELYNFGGPYLSIIKDDIEGASELYEKGLLHFPDDRKLLFNSGFHFYYEAKDNQRAILSLRKMAKLYPETPLLIPTLARLESLENSPEAALELLNSYENSFAENSFFKEKIYEYRYSLKAQIDLDCLNSKKENCSHHDLDGTPYLLNNGIFKASKKWNNITNKEKTK